VSRLLVFGAAGRAGNAIAVEAAQRGHEVVAVVRNAGRSATVISDPAWTQVDGDVTDWKSVQELLAKHSPDVVVIAVGGDKGELYVKAADTVIDAAFRTAEHPRVIHFGGGSSLTTPDGTRHLDLPDFPPEWADVAAGQAAALDFYQCSRYSGWTYFSPPPIDFFVGERRGTYRIGSDQPVTDSQGNARLSYRDAAAAIVDEIEHPTHINTRFTAGY
jgi:putative NADH-flavin reductase